MIEGLELRRSESGVGNRSGVCVRSIRGLVVQVDIMDATVCISNTELEPDYEGIAGRSSMHRILSK